MSITMEDLKGFMENWDPETKAMLLERLERGYRREEYERIPAHAAGILRAALNRLIPQKEEQVDLVGFLDWAIGRPLGRGDREEGLPPEQELLLKGISGIEETATAMFNHSFIGLREDEMDEVLRAIQEGRAEGNTWKEIPSQKFFIKLMVKALAGYCAHPSAWLRMGFYGPSYPEGYIWMSEKETLQREKHSPGWKTF